MGDHHRTLIPHRHRGGVAVNTQETTTFDLETARARVTEVTDQIAELFCQRQGLMKTIAEAKRDSNTGNLPIFLPQREQELLAKYRKIALERAIDPDTMDMLVSMLMSSAKFAQRDILVRETLLDTIRPPDDVLKTTLLSLTKEIAKRYDHYGERTKGSLIEFHREKLLFTGLAERHVGGIAINLGCADGANVSDAIREKFDRVIGYDISPDMVECARIKHPQHEFYVHDIFDGIPLPDESVELVIANSGAASDIYSDGLWREVKRVLTPNGQAFLSFYNREALVTKWWTPWSNGFSITINPNNGTIMVPLVEEDGSVQVYWINGVSLSADEIKQAAKTVGLEVHRIESSSPLWDDKPPEFYKHPEAVAFAMEYEEMHAQVAPFLGQYLRVVVKK